MPAPRNILAAAVEGTQVDIDTAFRIEARYFTELVCGQVSKNMTKAFFYDLQHINGGGSRPDGFALAAAQGGRARRRDDGRRDRLHVRAVGWEVLLKDVTLEAAEKGKGYSESLVAKGVKRGKTTLADGEALLSGSRRPTTTTTWPAAT